MSGDDIILHSGLNHEIELTKKAYKRVQQRFTLPAEVRGTSFVVCVGADCIFAGAFWTPVSSISFDGSSSDSHLLPMRALSESSGYPSPEAFTGIDPRSDQRIMDSLEAASAAADNGG